MGASFSLSGENHRERAGVCVWGCVWGLGALAVLGVSEPAA